jgi:hypothetical protein
MNSPNTTIIIIKKKKKLKNSTSSSNGGARHRRNPQEDAPRPMKKNRSKKDKTRSGARSRNIT